MQTMAIMRRFLGPPHSGNGGYVSCSTLSGNIVGAAEVMLRALPVLLLCAVLGAPAVAQDNPKVVTWSKTANSNSACEPEARYRLRVQPDRLAFRFVSGWEEFKADAQGKIKATTTVPATGGQARLSIEADLQTRKGRVTNLGNLGCAWEGAF